MDEKKKIPIIIAPMAGVTDKAFRTLCAGFGADVVVTEMVSAKALTYHNRKTFHLMRLGEHSAPTYVQLFGHEPQVVREAVKIVEDYGGVAGIDLNMGCPAPKIISGGDGSALMKNPLLAGQIMEAAVRGTSLPVTVKMRKGFDERSVTAPQLARLAAQCGIQAITIHPKTREQYFEPGCDYELIRQIKAESPIPVIGNGEIDTPAAAAHMLERTGCDGLMIGRGVLGRPWLVRQIKESFAGKQALFHPTPAQRAEIMREHVRMMIADKGEKNAMKEARKHIAWYFKGLRGAAGLRKKAAELSCYEDLQELLYQLVHRYER